MPANLSSHSSNYVNIYNVESNSHQTFKLTAWKCGLYKDFPCEDGCAPYNLNATECEMAGHSIEVLKHERDNIFAKILCKSYTLKCDKDGNYYAYVTYTKQHDLKYDENSYTAEYALLFAYHPTRMDRISNTVGDIGLFLDYIDIDSMGIRKTNHSRLIQLMSGKKHVKVDRPQISILFNDTGMTDDELLMHTSHTYVNVVHNCDKLCAQSVLSERHEFMSHADLERYGTLCAQGLIAASPQKQQHLVAMLGPDVAYVDSLTVVHNKIADIEDSSVMIGAVAAVIAIPAGIFAMFMTCKSTAIVQNIRDRTFNFMNMFSGTRVVEQELETLNIQNDQR